MCERWRRPVEQDGTSPYSDYLRANLLQAYASEDGGLWTLANRKDGVTSGEAVRLPESANAGVAGGYEVTTGPVSRCDARGAISLA